MAFLLLAPLVVARFPPVLDLPQQVAQVRLFHLASTHPGGLYRIQWNGPNKLSYVLLAAGWILGGASWGPRLGLLGCEIVFVASIFWLARRLGRPLEHAALAAVFLYSGTFYGGFFNFVVGAAGFVLWLALLWRTGEDDAPPGWISLFLVGALLYLAHALWLAMAGLLLIYPGGRGARWQTLRRGGLTLLPYVAAVALWYASLRDSRWDQSWRYDSPLLPRFADWKFYRTSFLGGLSGAWETIFLALVAIWALVALDFARRRRRVAALPGSGGGDAWLGKVALVLLATLVLPDAVGDTVLLDTRWVPWAAICALLALPPLPTGRRVRRLTAAVVVIGFALATTLAWRRFDRSDMRGFSQSIARIENGSRILELDFDRQSPEFEIPPFFQMGAYAQLEHDDVTLGYSFADAPSSLVVFRRSDWPWAWTRGLEITPARLVQPDLDHFDYVLAHVKPASRARLGVWLERVEPVAGEGRWWLYRVFGLPLGDPGPGMPK